MSAIHQLVAGFSRGDAISNEALVMRKIFRSWGYESEIFSENRRILPELRNDARDLVQHRAMFKPDDLVFLHLSIGSIVNRVFLELPGRKALLYHNITPSEYFTAVQPQIAASLARGREEARALAGKAEVNLADSQFNADELSSWGYRNVEVLPLVLDLSRLRETPNRSILKKYDDGLVNILFVGRCVPNKRIEDALAAFYYFQKYVEPNSRFIHAGSFAGTEQYHAILLTMIRDLQLENVELIGSVRQDELNACYQVSRAFLCMSEHEGFCIPLIESLVHDVPVVAYAAGAVPETLGGAGVLFKEKRLDLIAETIGRLHRDATLRDAVVKCQRDRLNRFETRNLEQELRSHLAPLLKKI
jgi:glycosyltransferase involved in cell wall biosynthesis